MNPIHKRTFLSFISHAHANKDIVDQIEAWLREKANIPVWYDSRHLPAGSTIASALGSAIEQCQTMIIVLSQKSVASGWVQEEYEVAIGQRTAFRNDFRIIPIRVEECDVPHMLRSTKWIDLVGTGFTLEKASELLLSLYRVDALLETGKNKDVFISRSWRQHPETEPILANKVCEQLSNAGFRLIGDWEDQKGFGEGNRVEEIISSCGGLVSILPDRGEGKTSKYMLQEIEFAQNMKMPNIIVAEETVVIPEQISEKATSILRIAKENIQEEQTLKDKVLPAVDILDEEWERPANPHYVFYGTDFDDEHIERNKLVRRIIEHVTAMPCQMGNDIRQGQVQQAITEKIKNAFMMIADISADNINTCIEAGIARGADTPTNLVAYGPPQRPPFMFRDQQVWHYESDIELLGKIHSIVRDYRRRIINYEL
jgi:hypothetical protein